MAFIVPVEICFDPWRGMTDLLLPRTDLFVIGAAFHELAPVLLEPPLELVHRHKYEYTNVFTDVNKKVDTCRRIRHGNSSIRSQDYWCPSCSTGPNCAYLSRCSRQLHLALQRDQRRVHTCHPRQEYPADLTAALQSPPARSALCLHFAYYNSCRVHRSLGVTPAMGAGIADHVWAIAELLS